MPAATPSYAHGSTSLALPCPGSQPCPSEPSALPSVQSVPSPQNIRLPPRRIVSIARLSPSHRLSETSSTSRPTSKPPPTGDDDRLKLTQRHASASIPYSASLLFSVFPNSSDPSVSQQLLVSQLKITVQSLCHPGRRQRLAFQRFSVSHPVRTFQLHFSNAYSQTQAS